MMRRLALLLCALMLVSGCRSWNVNLFNVPVRSSEYAATARTVDYSDPVMASEFSDLSKDEKIGVIVVLTVAVAAIVGGVIWAAS
jgi:hypothetical protein